MLMIIDNKGAYRCVQSHYIISCDYRSLILYEAYNIYHTYKIRWYQKSCRHINSRNSWPTYHQVFIVHLDIFISQILFSEFQYSLEIVFYILCHRNIFIAFLYTDNPSQHQKCNYTNNPLQHQQRNCRNNHLQHQQRVHA